MSEFKIVTILNKDLFKTKLTKKIEYLDRNGNFKDAATFENNRITLSGSRSRRITNNNILESTNSSFYNCLTKALLFAYFKNDSFKVESITIYIDETKKKSYGKDEIEQVFTSENLVKINPIKLLSNKKTSDVMMKSLMNLTLSFNNGGLRFDYTWKCFNVLISKVFNKKKDFDMLKELRRSLEDNPNLYPNIISFSRNIDQSYLSDCFLNAMICNNYPKGDSKGLINFCKDFEDARVLAVLKEKTKCKNKELNSINEAVELKKYFENGIKANIVKDT
ncbi:MAG: hypothetical protein HXK30_05745, partial [Atopobium sp.]|nr:hypothetical protein [Atopobium sp.]